ncbi:cyclin domain-containing protein [Diaporthe helianthi]|uniref:Cyclin domain-containing protein n=1 Tax=Diaporthe helianthi TaxID=158607 RepID=A0A2P5I9X5_DIAHE|nr:cyclin domain-containing protein [Diaporthe helianthi]
MAHMTNPLATAEQLYQRNNLSSLPNDLQDVIFYVTQSLTQAAGVLLQLPQSATAQANVILARYWLAESRPLLTNEFSDVSAACVFLVSKLGSRARSPRDISNVYAYLLSSSSFFIKGKGAQPPFDDPSSYYLSDADYFAFHNRVLALEARVLYTLSFDTHVALPHPLAVTYLQTLDFCNQPKESISRRTIEYLNTALLSPQLLYLTHQPNMLAVAAIYNAAKDVGANMPECEWWEVFDVEREELGFLVVAMRSLERWARKQREQFPWMTEGMVTREAVQAELLARGIHNGNGGQAQDEEAVMMAQMDEIMDNAQS